MSASPVSKSAGGARCVYGHLEHGLDGIVSKRVNGRYEPDRRTWLNATRFWFGVRWRSGPSYKKPSGGPQEACSVAAPYTGPCPNPTRPSGARRVAPGCGPSAALARNPGPFFLAMNRRLCRISSAGRVPVLSPAGNSAQLSPYGLHGHRSHVHPSSPHRTAHISLFGSGGNERWNRSFNRNRILA
jgi:hypothetical protein